MNKITDEEKTIFTLSRDFAVMGNNIDYMKRDLNDLKVALGATGARYITREEFDPIKRIVYGLITLFAIAIVGAILNLVLIKR